MKRQWKFIVVLVLGAIGLITDNVLHIPGIAEVLFDIAGAYISISLAKEMFEDLREGHWGIDVLALIAVISMMITRDYWAEWMILVMATGGESLEDYATGQANRELRALLDKNPQVAGKLVDGKVVEVKVDDLQIGDQVLIKPGQQVPVDGTIIEGSSAFDQSSLTGESVPVDKTVGDDLMSGSLNGETAVTMEVKKLAKDSEYQSIVELVKSSAAQPAKFVKMADRYAVPFTIISLIIGVAAWVTTGDFTRFAEVMVVASPCPLLIAAPVALVAGMSSMSKHHIIVKSGPTLEQLAKAKTFAFDKTGTLTQNQLVIQDVLPEAGFDKENIQSYAASLEQQSGHIIANSLVQGTDKSMIQAVSNLQESTGNGVSGTVDGKSVMVGKLSYVAPDANVNKAKTTAVYVSVDGKYAGCITFKDQLRPETPQTLARLRKQGAKHIMMLTGDNKDVAQAIADVAGVDDVRASLLPAQKIEAIKNVAPENRPVVMTGDGINDAPSLTAADVGIAMGAKGATAASESADAVIMVNDLSKINDAVAIAKHTMKVAEIDVITAILVVILLELVAFTGLIPAFWGAVLQEVVDMITICLALLAKTEPKNPKQTGL